MQSALKPEWCFVSFFVLEKVKKILVWIYCVDFVIASSLTHHISIWKIML